MSKGSCGIAGEVHRFFTIAAGNRYGGTIVSRVAKDKRMYAGYWKENKEENAVTISGEDCEEDVGDQYSIPARKYRVGYQEGRDGCSFPLFCIYMGDESQYWFRVIGEVVEGLEILDSGIKLVPQQKVIIRKSSWEEVLGES